MVSVIKQCGCEFRTYIARRLAGQTTKEMQHWREGHSTLGTVQYPWYLSCKQQSKVRVDENVSNAGKLWWRGPQLWLHVHPNPTWKGADVRLRVNARRAGNGTHGSGVDGEGHESHGAYSSVVSVLMNAYYSTLRYRARGDESSHKRHVALCRFI